MKRSIAGAILAATLVAMYPSPTLSQAATAGAVPDSASAKRDTTPFSRKHRLGAAIGTGYLGFGVGHEMLGYHKEAKRFALTQAGGVGAAAAGLMLAFAGCGQGSDPCLASVTARTLFYGGAAFAIGSRVVEIVDVVARPARHNAAVKARKAAPASRESSGVQVSPIVLDGRPGLALGVRW